MFVLVALEKLEPALRKVNTCVYIDLCCFAGLYPWLGEGRRWAEEETKGVWGSTSLLVFSNIICSWFWLFLLHNKEQLRRDERKNRDAFRKMMEEDIAAGTLTAKTHWRDYCQKVLSLFSYS